MKIVISLHIFAVLSEFAITSAGPKGGQKGHMPPRSDHKAYLAPRKKLIFDLMTPKSS